MRWTKRKKYIVSVVLGIFMLPAMFLIVFLGVAVCRIRRPPLAVRLGFRETDRILIVNADDGGMCQSANDAIIQGLENGMMCSATLMAPCPSFASIAEYAKTHPDLDFGVHLTHTSEWKHHRWGPVLPVDEVPGLVDPAGCFWHGVKDVYKHGTAGEAMREGRAQIRKALDAGIDVTHLDSHMGAMQYDVKYFVNYIRLGLEFDLPIRVPSQKILEENGAGWLRSALAALDIVCPDGLYLGDKQGATAKEHWLEVVRNLSPGVTEIYIHPNVACEESRSITSTWKWRDGEFRTFLDDPEMKQLIKDEGIILVGYRELRELQRR